MSVNRDCLYCSSRFEVSDKRRLFCTLQCRLRYNREDGRRCFYCGEVATDRDHIYPHSARTSGPRVFRDQETVSSCKDCNSRLLDHFPYSIEDRIDLLMRKITKKFNLNRPVPEWSDQELRDLGRSLRNRIIGQIKARQKAIDRVLYMQAVLHSLIEGTTTEIEAQILKKNRA